MDIRAVFSPKPDITAYELAVIYGNLTSSNTNLPWVKTEVRFTEEQWDMLGSITRHFEKKSPA